ncbi:hypothetical protein HDU85_003855 [Gaertneriomyces sp. JEL0708]|nr:hypothetical protein HDU85_003855 [Gaertneriomyces sp. JEL0708]
MGKLSILSLLALSTLVAAQGATDCGAATQVTFNQCLTTSILDPSGFYVPNAGSIENACAPAQQDQNKYFCCLCNDYKLFQGCYATFCPNSASAASVSQSVQQYCGACQAVQPTSSIRPTVSAAPTVSGTVANTPTPTSSTTPKANENSAIGKSRVFISGLAGVAAAAALL